MYLSAYCLSDVEKYRGCIEKFVFNGN